MNLCFEIEIHIYEKEISCDELLDENNPSYGIFGPSIMHSLRRNRFCQIHYQINDDSTLGDVTQAIIDRVTEGMEEDYVIRETDIAFLYGDNRYFIGNPDANMSILISQYLDPLTYTILPLKWRERCNDYPKFFSQFQTNSKRPISPNARPNIFLVKQPALR